MDADPSERRWNLPLALILLAVFCTAEAISAAIASDIPYQFSLFITIPVFYLGYGVVAGGLFRPGDRMLLFLIVPGLTRAFGLYLNAQVTLDPHAALNSMGLGFGLIPWFGAAALFAVIAAWPKSTTIAAAIAEHETAPPAPDQLLRSPGSLDTKTCPACRADVRADLSFCPECDQDLVDG